MGLLVSQLNTGFKTACFNKVQFQKRWKRGDERIPTVTTGGWRWRSRKD